MPGGSPSSWSEGGGGQEPPLRDSFIVTLTNGSRTLRAQVLAAVYLRLPAPSFSPLAGRKDSLLWLGKPGSRTAGEACLPGGPP